MIDPVLVISPAARGDLSEIYSFGLRNWGKARSIKYLGHLKEQFWLLTLQPLIGAERTELLSGVRSLPVESHIVFYRVSAGYIEIIRILHGRQDPNRHIK